MKPALTLLTGYASTGRLTKRIRELNDVPVHHDDRRLPDLLTVERYAVS